MSGKAVECAAAVRSLALRESRIGQGRQGHQGHQAAADGRTEDRRLYVYGAHHCQWTTICLFRDASSMSL